MLTQTYVCVSLLVVLFLLENLMKFAFAFLIGCLAGYLFAVWFSRYEEKLRERNRKLLFSPYITGEIWFATGNNGDMFDGRSHIHYTDAEFARCTRGLGQLMPDESITIRIPNVGSPRKGDAFTLRMRALSDPLPPHYEWIGCHLFAVSQGWNQAVR